MNSEATTAPLDLNDSTTQSVTVSKAFELSEKLSSVSIIFPAYNEEENIGECIRRVPKMDWRTEVIVISDGSADRTVEIVEQMQRKHQKFLKLAFPREEEATIPK